MGFNDFMAGLGNILTGLVGAGMKNADREYRAGRLDDDTYYSLKSDYSKLQSKTAKYQSRAEADRIQREAEEQRKIAEERERQRRIAEERERQRRQAEMLAHYNEVQDNLKSMMNELMGAFDSNKYHQKAMKKISRVIKKTVKIQFGSSEALFLNEKNKILFEYQYINLGYFNPLSIGKTFILLGYFMSTLEEYGYIFEPDDDDDAYEWFEEYECIFELMDLDKDEVPSLEYIPEERFKQQFYSFNNKCFGAGESFTIFKVDNSK